MKIDKAEVMSNGFLKIPAYLTRTGVLLYRKADGGILRELRHPDDVFNAESLQSLEMAPLTDDHPADFVTPDNVKDLAIGWVGENIKPNGSLVGATVVVSDKKGIAKVNTGKVELSCGYTADIVEESGTYEGIPYDVRQKNIRYNHVALVDRGRAGPQVRLRLDAEDASEVEEQPEESLMKIKIGDREFEVSQEIADAFMAYDRAMNEMKDAFENLKKQTEKNDSAATIADLQKKLDDSKKAQDALQAKLDVAEDKIKQHKDSAPTPEELDKLVVARTRVIDTAKAVLGDSFKDVAGKSNIEVMKAVVKKARPTIDVAEKSDTYIEICFDSIVDETKEKAERVRQIGNHVTDTRTDAEFDSRAKRDKMIKDRDEEWKQPLAVSKK